MESTQYAVGESLSVLKLYLLHFQELPVLDILKTFSVCDATSISELNDFIVDQDDLNTGTKVKNSKGSGIEIAHPGQLDTLVNEYTKVLNKIQESEETELQ